MRDRKVGLEGMENLDLSPSYGLAFFFNAGCSGLIALLILIFVTQASSTSKTSFLLTARLPSPASLAIPVGVHCFSALLFLEQPFPVPYLPLQCMRIFL